ncbi:hypothetical protein BJY04DRAFT_219690 [Aspergillus karnatakaensis]|uniref:uncharacterized protein n=1 Tax=Aspergillus karnatakaensis TaxID=1810916 RepID=UPI003CCD9A12
MPSCRNFSRFCTCRLSDNFPHSNYSTLGDYLCMCGFLCATGLGFVLESIDDCRNGRKEKKRREAREKNRNNQRGEGGEGEENGVSYRDRNGDRVGDGGGDDGVIKEQPRTSPDKPQFKREEKMDEKSEGTLETKKGAADVSGNASNGAGGTVGGGKSGVGAGHEEAKVVSQGPGRRPEWESVEDRVKGWQSEGRTRIGEFRVGIDTLMDPTFDVEETKIG